MRLSGRGALLARLDLVRGREYPYAECAYCRSLFCRPMPDDAALRRMYGAHYESAFLADPDPGGGDSSSVGRWLARLGRGTFLDYGCGSGAVLELGARAGWTAMGVEFDEDLARRVTARTGLPVVAEAASHGLPLADVLHLGDVIEHLTRLPEQMGRILERLRPGGVLLAQGPLEANPTLFLLAVRAGRRLRPGRRTEMPPYHVILATARAQRGFFRRQGLDELEYRVSETAWPAPERLAAADLARPRAVGLFVLRRLSRLASALNPGRSGNRYFYAGRRPLSPAR